MRHTPIGTVFVLAPCHIVPSPQKHWKLQFIKIFDGCVPKIFSCGAFCVEQQRSVQDTPTELEVESYISANRDSSPTLCH